MTSNNFSSGHQVPLDENWTLIAVLCDRSGSMTALNPENTAKQVNDLVHEQRGGKVTVTFSTFSDQYEVIKTNVDGKEFSITKDDIKPEGPTALQESLCRMIDDIGKELSDMTVSRPGKVVFIVLTDGQENASSGKYSGEQGRKLLSEKIKHQQEVYKWIFYFLGTNIDAINTGASYGIDTRTCINYGNSELGCTNVMRSASNALNRVRFASDTISRNEMLESGGFTQDERLNSQQT